MNMRQFTHFRKKSYHLIRNFGLAKSNQSLIYEGTRQTFQALLTGNKPFS